MVSHIKKVQTDPIFLICKDTIFSSYNHNFYKKIIE